MTIFISIVGLGLLIFVHELGHFGASLALHMRPRKFYIGFPPALVKRTHNGIETAFLREHELESWKVYAVRHKLMGDKLSVAGARGNQNIFMLDGVSNSDLSGNPQGAADSLRSILPVLAHAADLIAGRTEHQQK